MQNRGILMALRAAAIVVIVTGVNDVIASAVPRYEPLYLYLAGIALVGLLDGVIVAVAAAMLSVAFYGLLFMPRADALSSRIAIPAGAALAVAIVASLIRGVVRSRRRHREPHFVVSPPLLETSAVAHVTAGNEEVLAAIDDLRGELRTAVANLGASREDASAMAGRIAELELSLREAERETFTERQRGDEMQRALHEARDDAASRVAELESALAEERANFDAKLQTIVTHLASDHEADLGQALGEKEEARAEARAIGVRLAALQRRYDEQHEAAEALLRETRAAAQAEIERLRAAAATPPARPLILVVHPDAELRNAAGATLGRAGYEVVGAADGLEALRVAIARQPEIVIAESSMPKMDGRELCQLLKSQEKTAHIRFVLLMRGSDTAPQGELVPDEVLRKPVPVETLKATLASLLAPPAVSS